MVHHCRLAYTVLSRYQIHHHTSHTRATCGSHGRTSFLNTEDLVMKMRLPVPFWIVERVRTVDSIVPMKPGVKREKGKRLASPNHPRLVHLNTRIFCAFFPSSRLSPLALTIEAASSLVSNWNLYLIELDITLFQDFLAATGKNLTGQALLINQYERPRQSIIILYTLKRDCFTHKKKNIHQTTRDVVPNTDYLGQQRELTRTCSSSAFHTLHTLQIRKADIVKGPRHTPTVRFTPHTTVLRIATDTLLACTTLMATVLCRVVRRAKL